MKIILIPDDFDPGGAGTAGAGLIFLICFIIGNFIGLNPLYSLLLPIFLGFVLIISIPLVLIISRLVKEALNHPIWALALVGFSLLLGRYIAVLFVVILAAALTGEGDVGTFVRLMILLAVVLGIYRYLDRNY